MTPEGGVLDEKVLVLNRFYAAVRIVSARGAFLLLCKRVAEVIAVEQGGWFNYDLETWSELAALQKAYEPHAYSWVHTPRVEIAVPKVIRLLAYDRIPASEVKLNRRNIYARDHNRCQYCGRRFPVRELTIDHVVPRVQGGGNSWTNLVCACVRCNTRKGGRTPLQASMALVKRPTKPRRPPAISVRIGSPKYESWRAFLHAAYWTVELRD